MNKCIIKNGPYRYSLRIVTVEPERAGVQYGACIKFNQNLPHLTSHTIYI